MVMLHQRFRVETNRLKEMRMEKVIRNVTVSEKAWKIDGFSVFHFKCVTWMKEEQSKRSGLLELVFWVSNERFPVARLLFNSKRAVELFYYPQTQTAACLSGKTLHDSKQKLSLKNNLLSLYLNAKFPMRSHPGVIFP